MRNERAEFHSTIVIAAARCADLSRTRFRHRNPNDAVRVAMFACCAVLTACGAERNSAIQLLTVDGEHVAEVRDSLRGRRPQFQAPLSVLETEANTGLTVGPMSVMDKALTPPSGNKHDYMSQAPYWWPDPSKPNGKPYIRRDGQRNPEIDRITDRAELQRLSKTAFSLALAFYFTGHQDYAQHAAQLVRVWFLDESTKMNPNLNYGQGIPGIAEGRAAGIIETRFLPELIDAVTLLQGSPAWTASDDQRLKNWMRAFLKWLQESRLGREEGTRGNNQETWDEVQVTGLALYTGQAEIARAALERSRAAIGREFDPDGSQPRELARTRAWDYSIFNLTAFLTQAAMGDRLDIKLWNYQTPDGRSLRKGVEYLIPFATGEARFPYKQITPLRRSALHPILRRAAVGWNDPKYRALAQEIGGKTAILDLTFP
jgi:hypothetical protein